MTEEQPPITDNPKTSLKSDRKKVTIDLESLPGTFSAMLLHPQNMQNLAEMGMAFGQFISRDLPSRVFALQLGRFLQAVEEYQHMVEQNRLEAVTQTGRDTEKVEAPKESNGGDGQGTEESPADSGE